MKKILQFAILFISTHALSIQVEAPFGLGWGANRQSLEAMSITLSECTTDGRLEFCYADNLPKSASMADKYVLILDKEFGLQKVMMLSKDITSDATGSEGKELYGNVKSNLANKYNEPKSYEYSGIKLYDEYDEFYQCLAYDGCGAWLAIWDVDGGIVLELKGLGRGKGYLKLTYESPKWAEIVDALNNQKDQNDADAF